MISNRVIVVLTNLFLWGFCLTLVSGATLDTNLIVNPGAETWVKDGSDYTGPAPDADDPTTTGDDRYIDRVLPGWDDDDGVVTCENYVLYNNPSPTSFPPETFGNNMFMGGYSIPGAGYLLTQTIDVSDLSNEIDSGVRYDMSGWFGGYLTQADVCQLVVTFKATDGTSLGGDEIGVYQSSDWGSTVNMVSRSGSGTVPAGTRSLEVALKFNSPSGFHNGMADNLSLVLSVLNIGVYETEGSTEVAEDGSTNDNYLVKLNKAPDPNVVIIVDPNGGSGTGKASDVDLGSGPGVPISLLFTSANWDTPQTVTVTAVDNTIWDLPGEFDPDVHRTLEIVHQAISSDPEFDDYSVESVVVSIADNEVPYVTLSESDGWTFMEEGGTTDSYSFELSVDPNAGSNVQITATLGTEQGISSATDDAEENQNGGMNISDSDLELFIDTESSPPLEQKIGLRFSEVQIPSGATITNAYVQFTVDEADDENSGMPDLRIWGEDAGDAVSFTVTVDNISNRPLTSAYVDWSPGSWLTVGDAGPAQQTPNLTSIIQEIVNRGDWDQGDPIVLIIAKNPTAGSQDGKRTAESYEGGAALAPKLHVEFNDPAAEVDLGGGVGQAVTLTFSAGDLGPKSITVTAVDDGDVEGDEDVVIYHKISTTSQYLGHPGLDSVRVYIGDNDVEAKELTDDLILYLELDDDFLDLSGKNNHAEPNDSATPFVSGKVGNGVEFDANRFLDCGSDASLRPTEAITLSAWINADYFASYNGIANNYHHSGSFQSGYGLYTRTPDQVGMCLAASEGMGTAYNTGLEAQQWYHVVGSYDGASMKLFVDGMPRASTVRTGAIDYDPLPLKGLLIGRRSDDDQDDRFAGVIDQVVIWSRALSLSEIVSLYNGGSGLEIPHPAGLLVIETDYLTEVQEGNSTDSYTVALNTQPENEVTVIVEPNSALDLGNGAGGSITLTFSTTNWDTAQTVTVSAVDDEAYQGHRDVTITHTASSNDSDYSGLVYEQDVSVLDDDIPTLLIVETDDSTVAMEGDSDSYTIAVAFDTGTDVIVTIDPNGLENGDDVDLGAGPGIPITLTFTSVDYNVPQTVTVAAVDDDLLENDRTARLVHTAASSGDYDGLIVDLDVSVLENECGYWGFHPMDFNHDCYVDIADLNEFGTRWLECTEPYETGCVDLR